MDPNDPANNKIDNMAVARGDLDNDGNVAVPDQVNNGDARVRLNPEARRLIEMMRDE